MRYYGFRKEEIDNMSAWYYEQYLDNISNIAGWEHGGKLQAYPLIERMVDEQHYRDGTY